MKKTESINEWQGGYKVELIGWIEGNSKYFLARSISKEKPYDEGWDLTREGKE